MKRRIGLRPSQELRTLLKSCDLSQLVRSRRLIQCFAILHSNLCVHVLSVSCFASGLGSLFLYTVRRVGSLPVGRRSRNGCAVREQWWQTPDLLVWGY